VTAVAHELAANAVVHGAGHGQLRLWADDKFLYCQVTDDGRDGPAGGARQPDGTAPWPAEHGHGLWLAGQLADHVAIGRGPGARPPPSASSSARSKQLRCRGQSERVRPALPAHDRP